MCLDHVILSKRVNSEQKRAIPSKATSKTPKPRTYRGGSSSLRGVRRFSTNIAFELSMLPYSSLKIVCAIYNYAV